MNSDSKTGKRFSLRLDHTLHLQANDKSRSDGVSLNQFVILAVAEKLARMEKSTWGRHTFSPVSDPDPDSHQRFGPF
jgi:hypothetical protein